MKVNKHIITQINTLRKKLDYSKNLNELMGYEGIISKFYYESLSNIVVEDFKFKGRSRRPPRDPFNSLISLGYTMVMK